MDEAALIDELTANSADYGGAIHVDDDTNSGTCASYTKTECFFHGIKCLLSIVKVHFAGHRV